MAFGNLICSLGSPVSGVTQNYDSRVDLGQIAEF